MRHEGISRMNVPKISFGAVIVDLDENNHDGVVNRAQLSSIIKEKIKREEILPASHESCLVPVNSMKYLLNNKGLDGKVGNYLMECISETPETDRYLAIIPKVRWYEDSFDKDIAVIDVLQRNGINYSSIMMNGTAYSNICGEILDFNA